jgi:hypothetical protein
LLPLSRVITRAIMTSMNMADECRNMGNFRGIRAALAGWFRLFISLWGYADAPSRVGDDGDGIRLRTGIEKMC